MLFFPVELADKALSVARNDPPKGKKKMKTRPATRQEILAYCEGRRQTFETYIREVSDRRTENGVRHIRRATSIVKNIDGVPTVSRLGEDYELFGKIITFDDGTESRIPACLTIVRKF